MSPAGVWTRIGTRRRGSSGCSTGADLRLLAGTSGYGFRDWIGTFYPKGTKPRDFLARYAEVFPTVEVNYTFRRFPTPTVVSGWAAAVPEDFVFAVKANMRITHRARLRDVGELVADFVSALLPLGNRLGPVLFQCPPWFRRDDDRLEGFLGDLPEGRSFALEFRHSSWDCDPVRDACRAAGVALVAGIHALDDPPQIPVTSDFAYVRLRRDPPYTEAESGVLAAALRELGDRVGTIYLYVKHDGPGLAPAAVEEIRAAAGD